MKKFLITIIVLALALSMCVAFCACGNQKSENVEINIVVPDGTPALSIAKLMDSFGEFSTQKTNYSIKYEIVSGAAEVSAKVSGKKADIAIMPTNMAAKLFNKGIDIGLLTCNNYGSLYLIGNTDIASVNDLKNKSVVYTGHGGTPEFIFKYILEANGIDVETDLEAKSVSAGSDALAAIKQNTAFAAVVGEPVASMAKKQGIKVILDFQEEYRKITELDGYPQASAVASKDMIKNHPDFLKKFISLMSDNLNYITTEACEKITKVLQDNGSAVTFPTNESISGSNVKVIEALSAKNDIIRYFEIMGTFDSTFYGGKMPADEFYVRL